MTPVTVLVVDDHFVVRSGLAASLNQSPDVAVVGEAEAADQVVAAYDRHRPAVVLMDLRLGPGGDGLAATRALLAAHPAARVLVFSTFAREEDVYQAVRAGAAGYLLKTAGRDELLAAVRTVAAGGRHLPPPLAARLAARVGRPDLSDREREVLALLRAGRSNKEIGAALFIAEDTAKRHVGNLLAKLGAADRAAAVAEAIRSGLLPDD